mmetsp:Transcript_27134/g.44503  ORF Transcript_27134/g.44503 Transcript_27134/m.44503 type:complete len:105 (-) Transcript_27134:154-468(-)
MILFSQCDLGSKAELEQVFVGSPADEREDQKIRAAVQGSESKALEQVHIHCHLLSEATPRVAFTTKHVSCSDVESQAICSNKLAIGCCRRSWFVSRQQGHANQR